MISRRSLLSASLLALTPFRGMAQVPAKRPPYIIDGRIIIGEFNVGAAAAVVDGPAHEGVEITVDLPNDQHVKNFGAPDDNLGLCVFASMTMGARWHNVRALDDVIHKLRKGGGWPEKVDQVFKQFAPDLKYVQYEGKDPAILDKAMLESRMCHVTYGYGERYRMQTIAHMVNLVHLDQKWAAILDNNFPGTYEWMPREEFLKRWAHPGGQGWAYVMLAPPPPPVPHN
jgi:hypothetical protein